MAKNVKSVKNSLKFKAQPKSGILSVRVGVKKFTVPVDARILANGDYIFLSFPASSEIYRTDNKSLKPLNPDEDATEAFNALNQGRRRGRRRGADAELPTDLANALKSIPAGYRLGYGPDGSPRLVRKRKRGSKE